MIDPPQKRSFKEPWVPEHHADSKSHDPEFQRFMRRAAIFTVIFIIGLLVLGIGLAVR